MVGLRSCFRFHMRAGFGRACNVLPPKSSGRFAIRAGAGLVLPLGFPIFGFRHATDGVGGLFD